MLFIPRFSSGAIHQVCLRSQRRLPDKLFAEFIYFQDPKIRLGGQHKQRLAASIHEQGVPSIEEWQYRRTRHMIKSQPVSIDAGLEAIF